MRRFQRRRIFEGGAKGAQCTQAEQGRSHNLPDLQRTCHGQRSTERQQQDLQGIAQTRNRKPPPAFARAEGGIRFRWRRLRCCAKADQEKQGHGGGGTEERVEHQHDHEEYRHPAAIGGKKEISAMRLHHAMTWLSRT